MLLFNECGQEICKFMIDYILITFDVDKVTELFKEQIDENAKYIIWMF